MPTLQAVVEPETAGDPMSAQKWLRSSLRHLSARLRSAAHPASPPTVARLLHQLGYALHVNAKKIEASAERPDRQAQFEHIAEQKATFAEAGQPIISVDTKKKELVGNFKNGGAAWGREATAVNVHDFAQDALGRAVPYGIYEPLRNQGTVYVGQLGRHAAVCRRCHRPMVAGRGPSLLSGCGSPADLGRWRGQQRLPLSAVETAVAGAVG